MSTKQIEDLERENLILRTKLEMLEKMYREQLNRPAAGVSDEGEEQLSKLTLKQHAVALATLGGLGYDEIASLMQADVTTVKLHLKAVLTHLDVSNRNLFIIRWKPLIDAIPADKYAGQYTVTKDWWVKQPKDLMSKLTAKRSTLYRPPPKKERRR